MSVQPPDNNPHNLQPPVPTRSEVARAYTDYDPDENEYNLRDDLESNHFPIIENPADPNNIAARLMEMAIVHGDIEALRQLDSYFIKFELRKTSMVEIARILDVPVNIARKFWAGYKERQRRRMEQLEVNDVLSHALNAIDEYESELYRLGTNPQETTRNKIAALKAAAAMEEAKIYALDKNRFYERKGYQGTGHDEKDPSKKPQFIMNVLQNIFTGEPVEGDGYYKQVEGDVYDVTPEEDDNAAS